MKKYFIASGLILILMGCYMNYSQRLVYYPDPPDDLYGPMKSLLLEMGYKITTEAQHPDAALAALGYKDPYLIGDKNQLKVMVTFRRIEAETQIEIHVSQIGAKMSTQELDAIRDEVATAFKNKINNR